MHFANGPVHYRSVLAVHIDKIAVDNAIAGDNAVCRSLNVRHVEICASGMNESTDLHKTIVIKH